MKALILIGSLFFFSASYAESPALRGQGGRLRPGPVDPSARIYAQYAEQTKDKSKKLCNYITQRRREYSRRSTALVRDALNVSGFTRVPPAATALQTMESWSEQYVDLMTTEPFSKNIGDGVEALRRAPIGSLAVLDGPGCTSKPGQWGDIKAKCADNLFSSVGDKDYLKLKYCKVKAILVDKSEMLAIYPQLGNSSTEQEMQNTELNTSEESSSN